MISLVKRLNFLVACLVGLTLLGGCKKGEESHVTVAAPVTLDPGWTFTESRDHAVSLAVPSGWRAGADSAMGNLSELAASVGNASAGGQPQSDPNVGPDMQNLAQKVAQDSQKEEQSALANLERKGIIINVVNGSKPIPGEERTRFFVKKTHSDGSVSLLEAVENEQTHYAFKPKPTDIALPTGKAAKLSADDSLKDGATLHQISYVIVDGGDAYVLRFVTEEDAQSIQSVAAAVANSLRIKPSTSR